MKKLSLFSLLGLAGLLAFVAMPIYAQELDVEMDDEIVADTEDMDAENEFNYWLDEDWIAIEDVSDEIVDEVEADVEDGVNVVEDVDDSINEILWFLGDEESPDADDNSALNLELKLGDRVIAINPATFFLSGLWLSILIVCIAWIILCHISLWRIFGRAWEKKWKSLIPLFNLYIVFKIAGIKNWFRYMILVVIAAAIIGAIFPVVNDALDDFSTGFTSTVTLIVWFLLTKKFGRNNNASILYTIFSMIWILVLWLGNYKFQWADKKETETVIEA